MKRLLIVESPGKVKTIKKYLGPEWEVMASVGHVSDLPKKAIGIDKLNGFKPLYEVSEGKKGIIEGLSSAIREIGKENVYLATDEDREGEAISFHLCRNLGLDYRTTKRVTFSEITESVIKSAIQKPRFIDIPLVSAQEARRVIDRLVGYEVSPVLWKKIKSDFALSAGRVQSVALKLIVEREREIESFVSKSSFKIAGVFITPGKNILKAQASFDFPGEPLARDYLKGAAGRSFLIQSVIKEPKKTNPQAPFSTSTLQQDANKKLKFPVDKTMQVAQKLYEAGLITYMRTDSVNLSDSALSLLSEFIKATYGEDYLEIRKFKNKNDSAQEAHEAIRPSSFNNKGIEGTDDEKLLYDLIYHRAVASQMKAKETAVTTITINSADGKDEFIAKASLVTFDGFTKAYSEIIDEESADEEEPEIKEALKGGDRLGVDSFLAKQSYTKPKARFGEAELVKELEALGIGRPSTYASILKNIKDIRKYVSVSAAPGRQYETKTLLLKDGVITEQEGNVTLGQANGKLIPNPIGITLIDFLQTDFAQIMDYQFTARCEENFDLIASGKEKYLNVVSGFYAELSKHIVLSEVNHQDVAGRERKSTEIGMFEKKPVAAGRGEFGVYVRHNDAFYNVVNVDDFKSVTLDLAIDTIQQKRISDKARKEEKEANTLHVFGKYKIINGKFGPYITNGKDSAPVPKWDLDKTGSYDEQKCKDAIKSFKAYKKKTK